MPKPRIWLAPSVYDPLVLTASLICATVDGITGKHDDTNGKSVFVFPLFLAGHSNGWISEQFPKAQFSFGLAIH
jgi:hypothetical protein